MDNCTHKELAYWRGSTKSHPNRDGVYCTSCLVMWLRVRTRIAGRWLTALIQTEDKYI